MKFFKEVKRFANQVVGSGPYALTKFEHITRVAHSEDKYGIDHPESVTGILYQEDSSWVEYQKPTQNLTQTVLSRKIDNQPRYRSTGIFAEPPRIIYSLAEGGVAGNSGLIYDSKTRSALIETVHNWVFPPRYHPVLTAPNFPKPSYLNGISLSLLTLGAEGFYHFFHESLPKLSLINSLIEAVDHILINGGEDSWRILWLEKAKVSLDKVIWIDGLSHYRCEQLLFTSEVVANEQPNIWSVRALRNLLDAQPINPGDRWIWASRSDAEVRQLAWENELLEHFPKFEKICFSKLTPEETISLCRDCKIFAGPHGAAFSNIVFCNPNTLILELSPHPFKNPSFTRLAEICKLHHATAVVDFKTKPKDFRQFTMKLFDFLISYVDQGIDL